jgi:hypothetical protein
MRISNEKIANNVEQTPFKRLTNLFQTSIKQIKPAFKETKTHYQLV